MAQSDDDDWRPMATAPRDGTRILVTIRASEQGPAEVDVVRWARPGVADEAGWLATDSDAEARIRYAEAELVSWMPLPAVLPALRSARPAAGPPDEMDGSSI